ncbi:glutamyl-tRNA(Gln) amidotransferase subunit E [Candidatus Bathyarchaeota archaeon RBG_13_52_12]|nr:MAG: glutamyl-tRNA(Gln) amidotransferase subunit E [Candidatus Bathyarchaeota archaeon RBG_13_52_12]
MDYKKIGLKVGIEVHQELATKHKLFCSCPPTLSEAEPEFKFLRRLRPSQSELGEFDPAALFEFLQGKTIQYEGDSATTCLVEMDEEPPGPLDLETLELTLRFALMVGSHPVDEVHVMRKTVVDGSNTGGFQRTCVVSLGGAIEVEGKRYGIQQISLEEDAARIVGEEGRTVRYRLDRLGIPLMEIVTAPDMHDPSEVQAVALRIGSILRATGKVRRGLGTIRQDINVSIKGGKVVEIKGVQDLPMMPTIVEYEAQRQWSLLDIRDELLNRGVKPEHIKDDQLDASAVFNDTESKILKGALKAGGVVKAVKLPGFASLTGRELCPNRRLGTEMSDHAKYRGGVRGIFHTDELPGYSITQAEVDALRELTGAVEGDAVVIVADDAEKSRRALTAVVERALDVFNKIPLETRAANPDGTTRFTRPRPGAARMYPETDVKAITITPEHLATVKKSLPEMPEAKLRRFQKDYALNEKLARQIVDSDYMSLFEELTRSHKALTTLAAVTLTEDLKKLQRDGVPVEVLTEVAIRGTFNLVDSGETVKESIPPILTWLAQNPAKSAKEAIVSLGLSMLSEAQLASIIDAKIRANPETLSMMGEKAVGPIMGAVMAEVRGKAKAADVQAMIKRKLRELLAK